MTNQSTAIRKLKRGMVNGAHINSIHLPVTYNQAVGQGTKGYYSFDLVDGYNKAKTIIGEIVIRIKAWEICGLTHLDADVLVKAWLGKYDIPYGPNEVATEKPPKDGFTLLAIVLKCGYEKDHIKVLSELRNNSITCKICHIFMARCTICCYFYSFRFVHGEGEFGHKNS